MEVSSSTSKQKYRESFEIRTLPWVRSLGMRHRCYLKEEMVFLNTKEHFFSLVFEILKKKKSFSLGKLLLHSNYMARGYSTGIIRKVNVCLQHQRSLYFYFWIISTKINFIITETLGAIFFISQTKLKKLSLVFWDTISAFEWHLWRTPRWCTRGWVVVSKQPQRISFQWSYSSPKHY